jgi:MutS domain V
MPSDHDPQALYAQSLTDEQASLARLRRWLRLVVWVRIAVLIVFVVQAAESCSHRERSSLGAWLSALTFIGLSLLIAWIERRVSGHESRVRYFEAGQARVQGRKVESAEEGKRFLDPAHPYAIDLDVFGPSSLFALLCAARTGSGQATLARWLADVAPLETIALRQRAIAELRKLLPLRLDLWLAGGVVSKQVREDALESWLSAPATPVGLSARIATGLFGLAGVGALYAFWDPRIIAAAVVIVFVQRIFAYRYRPLAKRVEANVFQRAYELRTLARLAELLQRQHFSDPHLAALVAGISDSGKPASKHIFHLVRLVDWLESRRNQLFGIIAGALLLPEQLCFAIESWRARHGSAAVRWLAAMAEMEALSSIATFSFEHPEYTFPTLLPPGESPALSATGLGHPLLPAPTRICNDLALDANRRLLVVTGSNMSGKSTLLRTVGVNVVLAQAGAPVCATSMQLSPLHIGASLRAQDSLEQGVSRFFAEIKRLHAILQMAGNTPPVLFLLDEILNGTNSMDRREGAAAVVRRLVEQGAIGLVTTHDLALSDLAEAPELHGANIHFQDSLDGDRLIFDYRIRPGVVTRRNALDLMRLVGIDVPATPVRNASS